MTECSECVLCIKSRMGSYTSWFDQNDRIRSSSPRTGGTCLWSPGSWSRARSKSSAPLPWTLTDKKGNNAMSSASKRNKIPPPLLHGGQKNLLPMPSSAAGGGQKTVAPDQRRLDRKPASEHRPIEFVEKRLRVGRALRLFRQRQRLF